MASQAKRMAARVRGAGSGTISGTGTITTAGERGARSLGGQCRQGAYSRDVRAGKRKGDTGGARMARSGRADSSSRFIQY